jgi:hypothetical protein
MYNVIGLFTSRATSSVDCGVYNRLNCVTHSYIPTHIPFPSADAYTEPDYDSSDVFFLEPTLN